MTAKVYTRLYCSNCPTWYNVEVTELLNVHVASLQRARAVAQEKYGWSAVERSGELVDVCPTCLQHVKNNTEPEWSAI